MATDTDDAFLKPLRVEPHSHDLATALLSTEFFRVGMSCENLGRAEYNRERTFLAVKHQMGGGPLDKQGLAKAMQCRQILSAVMFHCSLHCSE
jgi:hypothetical protein